MSEGDIDALFERAQVLFPELSPRVWSRDPWVLTFDSFLTEDEGAAFIDTCEGHFSRSLAGDIVSPSRTSNQAWCQHRECVSHPLVERVHQRIVNVTSVPKQNAEYFQVVRYEEGQFYKAHHDQNSRFDSLTGVRVFTFFMYLGEPRSGGETRFTQLNLTIPPTRGSALWWPNVMNDDVRRTDTRTEHEATPP